MTVSPPDVIDVIGHVSPPVAALRRPVTREQSQASFDALFSPVDDTALPLTERWLVAAFVTRLTSDDDTAAFYARGARERTPRAAEVVLAEAATSATSGPFGVYAEAGLQSENTDGRRYEPDAGVREAVGDRVAAALAHAHLLTARLRETDGASHDALLAAGLNVDAIVTLSQLIAFLAFQQRVAAGLRVLSAEVTA